MILPEIGPVDGRTRPAIKFRETAAELVNHLGGRENVTAVQLEIVRRAAGFAVLADLFEERLVRDPSKVNLQEYRTIADGQRLLLMTIGLERVAKPIGPAPLTIEQHAARMRGAA